MFLSMWKQLKDKNESCGIRVCAKRVMWPINSYIYIVGIYNIIYSILLNVYLDYIYHRINNFCRLYIVKI